LLVVIAIIAVLAAITGTSTLHNTSLAHAIS
jgi:hypothetical protein